MISIDDYCWFVDEAIDGMIAIVKDLGDGLANQRLDLPGTSSPYAVLTHCLGVMEFWGGHLIAGRATDRDRAAEFQASGAVADLVSRTDAARVQLAADARGANLGAPLQHPPLDPADLDLPLGQSQGAALLHVYEELAQHRGQMETCRDALRATWVHTSPEPAVIEES